MHDGDIAQIDYQPDLKQLIFAIRLCEPWAEEPRPEEFHSHSGMMIFFDVERFKTDTPLDQVVWEKDFGLTIFDFEHKPELDTAEREGIWALLEINRMPPYIRQEILIMEFVASHFTWTPN